MNSASLNILVENSDSLIAKMLALVQIYSNHKVSLLLLLLLLKLTIHYNCIIINNLQQILIRIFFVLGTISYYHEAERKKIALTHRGIPALLDILTMYNNMDMQKIQQKKDKEQSQQTQHPQARRRWLAVWRCRRLNSCAGRTEGGD